MYPIYPWYIEIASLLEWHESVALILRPVEAEVAVRV